MVSLLDFPTVLRPGRMSCLTSCRLTRALVFTSTTSKKSFSYVHLLPRTRVNAYPSPHRFMSIHLIHSRNTPQVNTFGHHPRCCRCSCSQQYTIMLAYTRIRRSSQSGVVSSARMVTINLYHDLGRASTSQPVEETKTPLIQRPV